jgi:hypothetical protein
MESGPARSATDRPGDAGAAIGQMRTPDGLLMHCGSPLDTTRDGSLAPAGARA